MGKKLFFRTLFLVGVLFLAAGMAGQQAVAAPMLLGTTFSNSTSNLVELDPATGNLIRTIGEVGYAVNGLTYDRTTGKLYGATSINDPNYTGLIQIDMSTGAGTPIGVDGWGGFSVVANLAADYNGQMFGWTEDGDDLVTIDKETGIATVVGDAGLDTWRHGLAFYSSDTLCFVNGNGAYYTINTATGAATPAGDIQTQAHHGKFDPDSGLYYGISSTSNPRSLVVADLATGTVLNTIPTVDDLHTLTFISSTEVKGATLTKASSVIHKYKLKGKCDETVTIVLEANPFGTHTGKNAQLSITGNGLSIKDCGPLPRTITCTLPKKGKYTIGVTNLVPSKRFIGDYCLRIQSYVDPR